MRQTTAYDDRFDLMRWLLALWLGWSMLVLAASTPRVSQALSRDNLVAQFGHCVRLSMDCRGPTASCCKATEIRLGGMPNE